MRKIKEEGVYQMPMAEYQADPCEVPSLSCGIARTLVRRSPLHAWVVHPRLNPDFESEEKAEFDWGSACHALLLEGENRIVSIPFADYRKDAAKELRDAARAEGKYPILEHKVERVMRMAEAARRAIAACPHFQGLTLREAKVEEVIIWKEGKAFCRARPDAYWPQLGVGLDYKTTENAAPFVFSRQIARMGYEFTDAFYRRGLAKVFGVEAPGYLFMAQENEKPFACSFHDCAPSLREIAEREVRNAMRGWEWCTTNERWPAYDPRVHSAEASGWQLSEHMDQVEVEQNGNPYDPAVLWGDLKSLAA